MICKIKKIYNENQRHRFEIIEWITRTDDNSLLKILKSIKDSNATAADGYYELWNEELEAINQELKTRKKEKFCQVKNFGQGIRAEFDILWSNESKFQFDRIVIYFREKWTEKEANKFVVQKKNFERIFSPPLHRYQ